MAMNVICVVTTILLFALVGVSEADYSIGYVFTLTEFLDPPTNSATTGGSCCDSDCQDCCGINPNTTICTFPLYLCYHEASISLQERNSTCAISLCNLCTERANVALNSQIGRDISTTTPIQRFYTGQIQAYILISSSTSTYDEIVFQLDFKNASSKSLTRTSIGNFGRVRMRLFTTVDCSPGWNGTNCEIFCNGTVCTQDLFSVTTEPLNINNMSTSSTEPLNINMSTSSTETIITIPEVFSTASIIIERSRINVGIAVGVSVGAFVVLVIILCIFVFVIVMVCKKKNEKDILESYPYTVRSQVVANTVEEQEQRQVSPPNHDIDDVLVEDPDISSLYSSVDKSRKRVSISSDAQDDDTSVQEQEINESPYMNVTTDDIQKQVNTDDGDYDKESAL